MTLPPLYNVAADLLDRHLTTDRADHVAYRDDRGSITYRELHERSARAGRALVQLGVQPEQRVLLVMHDTVDFPAVMLGAMRMGAVPVPVNTLLTAKDYAFMLRNSRARAVVVSEPLQPKVAAALAELDPRPTLVVASSPLPSEAPVPQEHPRLHDLLERAEPLLPPAPTTPDDPAFWLYSSGSTGTPKAAVHLHSHMAHTATLYGQGVLGIRPDDVVHSVAKLFFAYGLGNALTFPLWVGATTVLHAGRPTPAAVAQCMRTHRPTLFFGVPTLFASLLADEAFMREGISDRLRLSVSAGEALPRHVGEAWRERVGSDILDGIGSTEMLHIFLSNRPGDVRYGTSGKPVPGYQLELRGEDGEPAADDEEGVLWVRGPSAAACYWANRAQSLATFHGPWARTGDRYARDEDGYYTYAGRVDDMLKVGGIWVSPFEVESALSSHPAVRETAVIGHPDPNELIKPKAFVVLEPGVQAGPELAAELKQHVKSRLAPYKYPRWIEFRDELPKTATGKIQRYKLRE